MGFSQLVARGHRSHGTSRGDLQFQAPFSYDTRNHVRGLSDRPHALQRSMAASTEDHAPNSKREKPRYFPAFPGS